MTTQPAVIVKKGGFLSALATGFFGFLTVCVVCGTALGYRGMNLVSSNAGDVEKLVGSFLSQIPKWRETLPPIVVESLNDRRAPEYAAEMDIDAKLVERDDGNLEIITVRNHGSQIVSFLALNIQAEDEDGVPTSVQTAWAATPFAFDEPQWRGPLLPGTSCKFSVEIPHKGRKHHAVGKVNMTVRDLRVAVKAGLEPERTDGSKPVELTQAPN